MGYLNDKEEWGRVPYFAEDAVLTGGPDCPDNIPIQALTNRTALLKKRLDDAVAGALAIEYANRLSTARKIGMSGDGSWSVQFDGGGNVSAALTLADSGVEAGAYPVITVDKKGRATAGRALQSADLPINAALPGEPTVKTPPAGAGDKRIVNAEFVAGALAALVGSAPAVLDTLNELAAALGNDPNFAATMANALANKAAKATTLAGYGIVDGATKADVNHAVPAGAVAFFAMSAEPVGWLRADGAVVSRTIYSALFAAIGTRFGAGDGATTFKLPDLRGEFVRGWDYGGGVDSSDGTREFGSVQKATAIANYTHSDSTIVGASTGIQSPIAYPDGAGPALATANAAYYLTAVSASNGGAGYSGMSNIRPRNIALLACIKF